MKKLYVFGVFVLLLIIAWIVIERFDDTAKKIPSLSSISVEILPNVYDDQQSTVYIKVDNPSLADDSPIVDIITKKAEWERQFPAKKIVAMSVVTGSTGGFVIGLLIHYEQH